MGEITAASLDLLLGAEPPGSAPTGDPVQHVASLLEDLWQARTEIIEHLRAAATWVQDEIPRPDGNSIFLYFATEPPPRRVLAVPRDPHVTPEPPVSLPGPHRVYWCCRHRNKKTQKRFSTKIADPGRLTRKAIRRALKSSFIATSAGEETARRLRVADLHVSSLATQLQNHLEHVTKLSRQLAHASTRARLYRSHHMSLPALQEVHLLGATPDRIRSVLGLTSGNVQLSSEIMGISESTFRRRVRKHKIDLAQYRQDDP